MVIHLYGSAEKGTGELERMTLWREIFLVMNLASCAHHSPVLLHQEEPSHQLILHLQKSAHLPAYMAKGCYYVDCLTVELMVKQKIQTAARMQGLYCLISEFQS
jgi:hypothetical protein